MKKIIAISLFALLLCAVMPFACVSADETIKINFVVDEVEDKLPGETFDITLKMENNPGLTGLQVAVDYDSAFELVEFKAGDFPGKYITSQNITDTPYNVQWSDATGGNQTHALFATLTFKVKEDAAAGSYAINVETQDDNFFDEAWSYFNVPDFAYEINVILPPCEHEYDAVCDPDCNKCGEKRDVHKDNIVHIDAVAPGCHFDGNIEYWYCKDCATFWQDEALTQLTNSKNVILPATGGDVVAVEAVAPGCHYVGNIAYWYCNECEKVWQDEALTQLTNHLNVLLPATGSDKFQHVAAKAPTCNEYGNIEYWFCGECEQFWQNEALTQLTNSKNVIIDVLAEHTIVHIDAVAPGCHYIGNIEYWYCPVCEMFWQDEALTQLTNSKNVLLPMLGNDKVQHVEAKEPTTSEKGNIEYWFCPECEQFWQDEALTQLTNSKNVILPAIVVEPESPATGDSIAVVVAALLALVASGAAVVLLKNKKNA